MKPYSVPARASPRSVLVQVGQILIQKQMPPPELFALLGGAVDADLVGLKRAWVETTVKQWCAGGICATDRIVSTEKL